MVLIQPGSGLEVFFFFLLCDLLTTLGEVGHLLWHLFLSNTEQQQDTRETACSEGADYGAKAAFFVC